jgi:hypothetical protein
MPAILAPEDFERGIEGTSEEAKVLLKPLSQALPLVTR